MKVLAIVLVLFSSSLCVADDDDKPHHLLECPTEITAMALRRLKGVATEEQRNIIRSEVEDQFDCDLD